jgi:glycerophosphoryl diester phosphodiesterase
VVADLTLAEIKRYSASHGRPEFAEERVPALTELTASLPPDVALALELKTDRFLEPEVAGRLIEEISAAGVGERTVVISFSLERILSVKQAAPEMAIGFITPDRLTPTVPVQLIGPYWPLLLVNPFYTLWAHLRGMLVAPLDADPNRRLWLYRLLGCDAILTDDPDATRERLGRGRRAAG